MPLLTLDNITKAFGGLIANDTISFEMQPGELLGVIGPNGAGKTTLFNVVSGYSRPIPAGCGFVTRTSRACRSISSPGAGLCAPISWSSRSTGCR